MKYLYLDNFRGFVDTVIPITDITFLVGENSTGKTSVLGLLNLLSSPQFWFSQSFDTEEVRFGHFKDIVSIHSEDRSYFTVGMIEDFKKNKSSNYNSRGFLMTFKEKSGLPSLSHYTYNKNNKVRTIRRTAKKVFVKELAVDANTTAKSFIDTALNEWKQEHITPSTGYSNLAIPRAIAERDNISLPLLLTVIDSTLKDGDEKQDVKGFQVYLPSPSFRGDLVWLAPIRTTPKRTYDEVRLDFSPEGSHTPYLVRKILASKSAAKDFKKKLEYIGKQSSLFESISIQQYGKSATSPFELDIVIGEKALNINTVGYGVSQSLPVIVELLHRDKGTWFAIQQPEVHLHPKAQAALGDLFFELALQENKGFLVETHSDFLIDRFRLNYRTRRRIKPDAQVLFFERKAKKNTAISLRIDGNGGFPSDQPNNYREFFIHEEMKLLGL